MVKAQLERRGFALVAALWLLILIAGVAAALQGVSVGVRRAAINSQLDAKARWQARGAISRELASLDDILSSGATIRAPGGSSVLKQILGTATFSLRGSVAQVTVTDPASRVNVNTANAGQLLALFEALGIDNSAAARITNEIMRLRRSAAERESGDMPRSELEVNSAQGKAFADLSEISLLRSIDGATFRRVAPFLTVYGAGRVNLNLASPAVLATIPGLYAKSIGMITERRKQTQFSNAFEIASQLEGESRTRLQAHFAEFEESVSFTPRELLLDAGVPGLGGKVVALVRLEGGKTWSVESVLER